LQGKRVVGGDLQVLLEATVIQSGSGGEPFFAMPK
jgi:hypothetical protein